MGDPSLCFVMPAHKRFTLSGYVFGQRMTAIQSLKEHGIDATCVVIADDYNLELARSCGFETIETKNDWLGKKFNDGHEWAAKNGYTHVCPVGSDMFVDPSIFYGELDDRFSSTNYYSVMCPEGNEFIKLNLEWGILQFWPVSMMKKLDYRPTLEEIKRGCDTYTRVRIMHRSRNIKYVNRHYLECVSFQSAESQITKFDKLRDLSIDGLLGEPRELLDPLREYYYDLHVDAITRYYEDGHSLTTV